MYNNINEYREYKYYQNVLYNGIDKDNYNWIYNILELKKFYNVCNYYLSNNFITYNEIKNIKEVLKLLLKEQDETRIGMIYYIYNKALFSISKTPNEKIYNKELNKRKIKNTDTEIKILVKNDLEIIDKMLVSDIDFYRNLNSLVNNENFIFCINSILEEYPKILKYNDFYERVNRVLKLKQEIKNEKVMKSLKIKMNIKRGI